MKVHDLLEGFVCIWSLRSFTSADCLQSMARIKKAKTNSRQHRVNWHTFLRMNRIYASDAACLLECHDKVARVLASGN